MRNLTAYPDRTSKGRQARGYITLHKTTERSAFLRRDDVVSVYQDQMWNIMIFGFLR